jgi:hypothetical protein
VGGLSVRGARPSRATPLLLAASILACSGSSGLIFTPRPAPGTTPSSPDTGAPTHPATDTPLPATTTPGQPTPDGSLLPTASTTPSTLGPAFEQLVGFPTDNALEVTGVTATPGGFTAVGFGALPDEGYFGRRQGIVWTSTDGRIWSQSVDPALQFVTPRAVVALGNDVFVFGLFSTCPQLVYYSCTDAPDAGNAAWRSAGGGPWERLAVPPQMQLGLIDDVAAGADRLAVFGGAGAEQQTSALWLTSDGINWAETTDLAGLDPVSSLALGTTGVVALGTSFVAVAEDIQLVAAFSTDGIHFTPAAAPGLIGAAIDGVAEGGSGFVGVGYETSEDVSLGGVALHSPDGMSWTQAGSSDDSFAGSVLIDVHDLSNGYVALGFKASDEDFTVQDGRAWISADGKSWRLLAPLGATFTHFGASALGQGGLVVFAADQQEVGYDDVASTILGWFVPIHALTP